MSSERVGTAETRLEAVLGASATHRDEHFPAGDSMDDDRQSLDALISDPETQDVRTEREFTLLPQGIRWWRIYGLHFLFKWNARTFEYVSVRSAAPVTVASAEGIVATLSSIVFSSSVGAWIDRSSNQATPFLTSVCVNHGAIVLAYLAWMFWPALVDDGSASTRNVLFGAIIVLDVIQNLSATANSLSLGRDWIPSLVGIDLSSEQTLTQVNAVVARVDLLCKVASPSLLPIVISTFSRNTWIAMVTMSTVSVWCLEVFCLHRVTRENPRLLSPRVQSKRAEEAVEDRMGEPENLLERASVHLHRRPLRRIRQFFSMAVWPASITTAFLYLTVLVYSATLITYLLQRATQTLPPPSLLTGKIPVVLVLWNLPPSSPGVGSTAASAASQASLLTTVTLFGFLSLSRLFLWTYSLMEQEIEQSEVPASQRSTFSGTGESFRSCFDLLHWTATVVWSRPEEFKGLAGASLIVCSPNMSLSASARQKEVPRVPIPRLLAAMIFASRKDAAVAAVLAAALLLIWASLISIRGPGLFYEPQPSLELQADEDGVFLRQAMRIEFPAPIDYAPIREVCTRAPSTFRPGLLFSCEQQHGGVGMVRNQILKCLRYAIHAGAAVVVPSMARRNPADITDIETSNEVPLEYLFDREAFVELLTGACPGMRLYNRAEDFPNYAQRAGEPLALVGDQFEPAHPRTGLEHPREWRGAFDGWLEEKGARPRAGAPVLVRVGQSYIEYPVHSDGDAFAREFGKILSFRPDTRALAARVLCQLQRRFALPIDPARAISPDAFYGAHLRLEKDAVWAWDPAEWRFSRAADQFEAQYQHILETRLDVVYVASGDRAVVDAFAAYLRRRAASSPAGARRNLTVVTKHDLLPGRARRRLDALTFDQQALVDFLVLSKASAFMGVAHSSFPWTVALRRHELSAYAGYANLGSDILRDEYSTIMGMRADYPYVDPFEYGLWP
ncbi:hypothetical protein PZA11_003919 [Diplocarpon coronariae]